MTKAEACIWKFLLSAKQMMGYSFRRQRPVLNYIADFMCKELMLIIEVDGLTHQWESVAEKDLPREKELIDIGFTLLRFSDEEVLKDLENVNRAICFYIEKFENKSHLL
jgi:very-short-patch-repair endonuclease